jgi:hypothetical protein
MIVIPKGLLITPPGLRDLPKREGGIEKGKGESEGTLRRVV